MKYILFENIANRKDLNSFYLATKELFKLFDVEVKEFENTIFDEGVNGNLLDNGMTSLAIDAYNLATAEEAGLTVLCLDDASFNSYTKTKECLASSKELRDKVNAKLSELDREFKGTADVKHIIDVIVDEIGIDKIASRVKNSFKDFNIALHYGNRYCQLKEASNIDKIEEILSAIGATVIKLDSVKDSLGYEFLNVNSEIAIKMAGEILLDMFDSNADIVTSTDTNAFMMFDKKQGAIECEMGRDIKLPFLNIAQLILLAIGEVESKKLGFEYHKVTPRFI